MTIQDKSIHFLAVGGVGMSALANLCASQGARISGCDLCENGHIRSLRERGFPCYVGHHATHLDGVGLVVYSSAIKSDNPELQLARARGIPTLTRAHMLALLQEGKQTIAIAGAHGKTTTTWIAANALLTAGLSPSIMVGGNVSQLGGNWYAGSGPHFVTEVDESDGSLLEFHPVYSIITNVDREHLDYYRDLDDIRMTFARYMSQTSPDGWVIACADDLEVAKLLDSYPGRRITYGFHHDADVTARYLRLEPQCSSFEVFRDGQSYGTFMLSLPGEHNVLNALAVVALGHKLGISMEDLRKAFATTQRVARRLQVLGEASQVTVIDDYGHHPSEIRATIKAARRMAEGRLIGVFQPHRYTRTQLLCQEFGAAFAGLDELVLAPIYAASEKPIEGVSSELIADAVRRCGSVACEVVKDIAMIPARLFAAVRPGDTVLTIGAGDVNKVGERLLQLLADFGDARCVAG